MSNHTAKRFSFPPERVRQTTDLGEARGIEPQLGRMIGTARSWRRRMRPRQRRAAVGALISWGLDSYVGRGALDRRLGSHLLAARFAAEMLTVAGFGGSATQ